MLTMREVVPLGGHLLEDRVHDAARTAPGRPEVDQHRLLGLEHLGLEVPSVTSGSFPVTSRLLIARLHRLTAVPRPRHYCTKDSAGEEQAAPAGAKAIQDRE